MTDPILPDDLANGLLDGTADLSSVPTELRGLGELFAAAHQPATDAELVGMATAMEHLSTVVTATTPVATAATTSGVVHMLGTRITKRAAVIVAATLLTAGTAAAAAGGVIPSPFSPNDHSPVTLQLSVPGSKHTTTTATTMVEDSTSSTETSMAIAAEEESTTSTSTAYPPQEFGLCTAWNSGAPKNTNAPAFSNLLDRADAAGQSIDDYCNAVFAAKHGDDTSTSTSTDAEATGSSVDDHGGKGSTPGATAPGNTADSHGQNGKGKGKGGSDTSSTNP